MGLMTLPYKVAPNENIRDLSGGDCDLPICMIVCCVWVCDKSYIKHILGRIGLY